MQHSEPSTSCRSTVEALAQSGRERSDGRSQQRRGFAFHPTPRHGSLWGAGQRQLHSSAGTGEPGDQDPGQKNGAATAASGLSTRPWGGIPLPRLPVAGSPQGPPGPASRAAPRAATASLGTLGRGASEFGVVHPNVPRGDDSAQYRTVMVAIWANVAIACAKAVAFLATGSSAMLAEFVHSCVDVLNQYLLRLGVLATRRSATADHPYGYSKDVFVWSLIAGVGIFCFGGGVSLVHGINALFVPHEIENLGAGLAVMALSFVVEGYSLKVALDTVRQDAKRAGMSLLDYISRGRDPTTTAVLVEDSASVIGVTVAGAMMYLTHATGAMVWDAAGSIFVGCLLAASAGFLIQSNRKLLIGRAMGQEERAQVLDLLRCDPVVAAVYDTKSEELGPGLYRFKAEIEFSGDQIVRRHLDRVGRAETLEQIRSCSCDNKALERALREFGKDVISSSGAEIDRIEQEIKCAVKGIRHVDIETDRGRWFRGPQDTWPWGLEEESGRAAEVYKTMEEDTLSSFAASEPCSTEDRKRT